MSRPKKHKFPKGIKKKLEKSTNGCCSVCGNRPTNQNPLEVHHIVPVSQGGATVIGNGQIVCRKCHVEIHQKMESLA
jgi:5-methylcytosine-specific restriction endonuclease McrA